MTLDPMVLAAFAAMAGATYFTRIAGFWLVRRVRLRGPLAGALAAMPGSILVALIAPTVLSTGPAESGAALVTVALAWRLPPLVAIAGGVASVVALRALTG